MATAQELVDALLRLTRHECDAVILQAEPFYVQAAMVSDAEFVLEAVSGAFLPGPLTAGQLQKLHALRFQPPGQLSPNHWQHPRSDAVEAARILIQTLSDVYGVAVGAAEVIEV